MLPSLLPDEGFNRLVRGRHGHLLYNRNDTVVGLSIAHYGEYFESEVDVFQQMLRPGARVADLGANIGTHTVAMARIAGETGWVTAFEPQRLVFQTLCANVALNSLTNVDCQNMAVSDTNGTVLVEELNPHAAVNFGGLELGHSVANRSVRCTRLDDFLNGDRLDFMKIDIQGMEEVCLRGARETLKRCNTILYLENDQAEKSPPLLAYLKELGYAAYWHLPMFFNSNNFAAYPVNLHMVGFYDAGGEYLACNGFAINMLCVPKVLGARITGLLEATDLFEHPLTRGANRFHEAIGG